MSFQTLEIANVATSTHIVIGALLVAIAVSLRPARHTDVLAIPVTQELKGVGMLAIVFAHIAFMLVSDGMFLFPLTIAAGVGVDLFLFMSGFGLTVGMLKKPMSPPVFYQRRLIKVFIPLWVALVLLFTLDATVHDIHYSIGYMVQSFLGWFPQALPYDDVNSPFWYITWMVLFYALFPVLFMQQRPWFTAILLALIANILAFWNPLHLQAAWLHQLHTCAFSLGIIAAWLLQERAGTTNSLTTKIKAFRDDQTPSVKVMRGVTLFVLTIVAGYMAYANSSEAWPTLSHLLQQLQLNEGKTIGQFSSLATMAALLGLFSLKRFDCKFLYWCGFYSYEMYLLHWPIMMRYDVLFRFLPGWAAVIAYIALFIALGWLLQKITTPLGNLFDKKPASA